VKLFKDEAENNPEFSNVNIGVFHLQFLPDVDMCQLSGHWQLAS